MKIFTRTTLATLISALLSGHALAVDAPVESNKAESKQEHQAAKDNSLEVIEVTGFVDSLDRADRYKKNADSFLDAISAENVGELPADNIGDALFGLPGVDMNFEDGEASNIIIGGLPAEYNQIQSNGVTIPSLSNSGGSEGAASISGFSTALVAGIEVIKSGTASADEGALGGTINILNWQPLTFKDTRFQVGATAVHHENTEETDGQFNFLYGDRNSDENFGWVLGGTIENKSTGNESALINNSWRSRNLDGDDANGNETLMPTNIGYRINRTTIERTNYLVGLQYKLDDFDFDFNYSYTKFDRLIEQNSIRTARPAGAYLPAAHQVIEPFSTQENDAVTHIARAGLFLTNDARNRGTFTNMDRNDLTKVEENQNITLDMSWYATDKLTVDSTIGYALSTFAFDPTVTTKTGIRNRDSVLWNTQDGLATFQTINREAASLIFNGGDLAGSEWEGFDIHDSSTWDILTGGLGDQALDPSDIEMRRVNTTTQENKSETLFAQLDFTYYADIDFLDSVKFGVKYSDSDIERRQGDPNSGYKNWNGKVKLSDFSSHSSIGEDIFGGGYVNPGTWLTADASEFREATMGSGSGNFPGYGQGEFLNYFHPVKSFERDFSTLASYVQVNFSGDDFIGNFGVRYVKDDTTVSGYAAYDPKGDDYPFLDANGNPKYVKKGNPIYPNNDVMFIDPIANPGLESYVDQAALDDLINVANYKRTVSNNEQEFFLPSFNLRYSLTDNDDMLLRFAASRSMARQPIGFTSAQQRVRLPGDDNDNGVVSIDGQNPHMKATMADAGSLGFEWYYAKASSLTMTYNYKHLTGMRSQFEEYHEPGTFPDVNDIVPSGYEEYPVIVRLREANGSGAVQTSEVQWRHRFSSLDGWLGKTGITTNYTYTDSYITAPIAKVDANGQVSNEGIIRLPSAARHSVNTQVYYQGEKFTARLAYTFRTNRLQNRPSLVQKDSRSTTVDFRAGQYADYVRNLDLSLNYKVTEALKVNFNVNNIMNNDQIKTLEDGTLVSTIRHGRQFKMSAIYQF